MRALLCTLLATAATASAQVTLPANPPPANNGGSAGWALFFDFDSTTALNITHLRTASTAAAGANFTVEVFVRSGTALGGPVGSGAGSSTAGWTSLGTSIGTQGPGGPADVSDPIDIPNIFVPAGATVGVALQLIDVGPRYFGSGTAPIQMFSDANLTLTTGDSRSSPFTTSGSLFSSRGLVGDVTYVAGGVANPVRLSNQYPGVFIDISGTGAALGLSDDGEVDIPTTVTNALFNSATVRVGSNGAVRFAGAALGLGFTNSSIPSASAFDGEQTLMPFWDDVNTASGVNGDIYWEDVGGTLIVQWDDVGFFGSTDRATFQLQVPSDGPTLAQFIYTDIESVRADGGGSATIGYQSGGLGNDYQYGLNANHAVRNGDVLSLVEADVVISDKFPGTYIDISATGTPLSLIDDGEVDIATTVGNALLPSGIARVGSNGAVRFSGAGASLGFTNRQIPDIGAFDGDQTLMPFWDDVDTNSGAEGEIYWQEIGNTLIIQWEAVEFFPGGTGGVDTATFQIQVHGAGPAMAQFIYADVSSARADGGGSATIGYQAGGVGNDSQYSFDFSGAVNSGTVLSIIDGRAKVGSNYCIANANSTGGPSRIAGSGSTSVAANDLTIRASSLPTNAFGYFLASTTTGFVALPGGSQGNLCLSGNIGRGVGVGILNTGSSGSYLTLVNLVSLPTPGGSVAGMPGDTWNFQSWHRDAIAGVATSNFTNGLQVQLTP